jgi:hypothetical protein
MIVYERSFTISKFERSSSQTGRPVCACSYHAGVGCAVFLRIRKGIKYE